MRDLEIFAQAIEILDPAQRHQFLADACGDDGELADRVKQLIESFLLADHPQGGFTTGSQLPEARNDSKQDIGEHQVPGQVQLPGRASFPLREKPSDTEGNLSGDENRSWIEREIGPYKLLERIGEGGFGEVYVAEQLRPVQRKVALKVIKPGMDSREVIARFTAERQALALMDHPNIAKVFDGGTTRRGLPYFVMELVRGISIVKYCDSARLNIEERLKLFLETCRAIQHAHQKGIIHRDIKPSNVMVTLHDGKPVVKVIDFGVAKALNQRLTEMTVYTRYSFMIGTPAYMSPEQAEFSGLDIDTRSDVYSLGVLLYELVTGSQPFGSERFAKASIDEMRRIIREEDPPKPSTRVTQLGNSSAEIAKRRGIPEATLKTMVRSDLDWIIMKSLCKDRSLRYESAHGFAQDVQRFLKGDAILARPPTWNYLLSRSLHKHRRFAIALGGIALTMVLGAAISIIFAFWALRERQVATTKSREAAESAQAARLAENQALEHLLASRMAFTNLNLKSGQKGQQTASLKSVAESTELAVKLDKLDEHVVELRSQAIASLARWDLEYQKSISIPSVAGWYSFSQDFSRLAYRIRSDDGDFILVVDPISSPPQELMKVPIEFDTRGAFHDEARPLLNPSGRYLIIAGGSGFTAVLWDLAEKRKLATFNDAERIDGFAYSPDGQHLAVLERNEVRQFVPRIYNLKHGNLQASIDLSEIDSPMTLAWSPNSRFFAVGHSKGISLLETDSWTQLGATNLPPSDFPAPIAFSAASQLLALGREKAILVWDLAGLVRQFERTGGDGGNANAAKEDALVCTLQGHEAAIDLMVFDPLRDSILVSSSWDNSTRLWNVFTGTQQLAIPESRPQISSDGMQLVTWTPTAIQCYYLKAGDACRWIGPGECFQAVIGSRSRWMAAGTFNGTKFWSLPGLKPLGQLGNEIATGLASCQDELLVGNESGLYAFPESCCEGTVLELGPGQLCLSKSLSNFASISVSCDGRWIAAHELSDHSPLLLDRENDVVKRIHSPQRGQYQSVSPNGRWYVRQLSQRIVVVDLESGQTVKELEVTSSSGLGFTKDSQYLLVTGTGRSQVVSTRSWNAIWSEESTMRIDYPGFSSDSNWIAVARANGDLQLRSTQDGTLLTRLTYTDSPAVHRELEVSSDSRWLVTTHAVGAAIWDLEFIHSQLEGLGIDWRKPAASQDDRGATTQTRDNDHAEPSVQSVSIDLGHYDSGQAVLANLAAQSGSNALRKLTEMIDRNPGLPSLYAQRASIHSKIGNDQLSIADWKRALQLAPYCEQWRWDYAVQLELATQFDEAGRQLSLLADPEQSRLAASSSQWLARMACAHPESVPNREEFRRLVQLWTNAIEGLDKTSAFAFALGTLSQQARVHFDEAIGMAWFELGEYELARKLMSGNDSTIQGSKFVRACLHALDHDLPVASQLYERAANAYRMNTTGRWSKLGVVYYDRLEKMAARLIDELRKKEEAKGSASFPEEPKAESGVFDSVDLIRAATVSGGELFLYPSPTEIEPDDIRFSGSNFLFWLLRRPDESIDFKLPVPTPGRYRLSARWVHGPGFGRFQVLRDSIEPNKESANLDVDLSFTGNNSSHHRHTVTDHEPLGVYEAEEQVDELAEEQWYIRLKICNRGAEPGSEGYDFGLDDVFWQKTSSE